MAQQFNLTAQINLQSPKNVGKVVSDIQRQLKGSGLNTVNIKVKADPRSMAQTNKQLQNVGKNSRAAAKDINTLNRSLKEATRRFSVITLATGTLLSFVTGLKNSTKAAIEFERELIKISQVTGKSVQQLQGLTKEVTRLSTALGVSSADLLNVSRTLAQAGFNAEQTRKSLDILAKTTLAATFDNIQDTTEGAIALLRQFGDEAKRAGGDVAFLEKSLSAINSVSKKFAVESGDLITVIRRVGGVFSSAGGSINELIALFTSVRSTTRESAETIATGLRTIFTRIQRTETVDALKNLNIELRDSKGNFVGAFEAVKRLSAGLSSIDPKSATFSNIVEQLGGFRQIGKVIPLIQQFATAQDALRVAQSASGSVAKDAATAQQGLGVQIQKVREEFTALVRQFSDSGPFNTIATGALKIASAMIKVAEAVEPLLPLLTTMFGLKLGRALAPGLGQLAGIGRRGGGGGGAGFSRFARGGMVPGQGNRDTVPAMLTPGEFVIKKSSVKKMGSGALAQMNQNGYAAGGKVTSGRNNYGIPIAGTGKVKPDDIRKASTSDLRDALKDPKVANNTASKLAIQARLDEKPKTKADNTTGVKVTGASLSEKFGVAFLGDRPNEISSPIKSMLKASNATGKSRFYETLKNSVNRKEKQNNIPKERRIKTGKQALVKYVPDRTQIEATNASNNTTVLQGDGKKIFTDEIAAGIPRLFQDATKAFKGELAIGAQVPLTKLLSNSAIGSIEGQFFEAYVRNITGKIVSDKNDAIFDFASGSLSNSKKDLDRMFGPGAFNTSIPQEFKNRGGSDQISSSIGKGLSLGTARGLGFQFANKGGGISGFGSDTVPAMLTPGEFVFNKGASKSIGYGNLKRMNEQGVKGYAAGGVVSTGRNNYGTPPAGGFGAGVFPPGHDATDVKWDKVNEQVERAAKNTGDLADKTQKAGKEQDSATQSISKTNKERLSVSKALQGVKAGVQKFVGGLASGAQAAQGISRSAQSFIFAGVAIGAVTSQMSGLEESTKKAVNEVSAFAAGFVGIGATLIDTISSIILAISANTAANNANTLSELTEKGANELSTTSELQESATNLGGGFSKLLGPLALVGIALGAVVLASKYTAAKLRAQTNELIDSFKKLNQRLNETGLGGGETVAAARVAADLRTGGASTITEYLNNAASNTGIGGIRFSDVREGFTQDEIRSRGGTGILIETEKRSEDLDAILTSNVESFTELFNASKQVQEEFDRVSSSEFLTGQEKIDAQLNVLSKSTANYSLVLSKAQDDLGNLSTGAARFSDIDAYGGDMRSSAERGVAQSTSIAGLFENAGKTLSFDEVQKEIAKGAESIIDPKTAAAFTRSLSLMDKALQSAAESLKRNRAIFAGQGAQLTGRDTFESLRDSDAPIFQTLKRIQDDIRGEGAIQVAQAETRLALTSDPGAKKAIQEEIDAINLNTQRRVAAETGNLKLMNQAAVNRYNSELESIEVTKKITAEQKRILQIITGIDEGIAKTKRETKVIENLTSVRAGGSVQASATRLTNTDLSSVVTKGQRNQLSDEMEQMISNAPAAEQAKLRKSANQINDVVKGVGKLNKGTTSATGLVGDRGSLTTDDVRDRLKNSLGDIPPEILKQIVEDIDAAGSVITPEELANALSKYTDLTNEQISIFGKLTTLEQSKLEKNRAFLSQQEQAYNQELKGRANHAASLEQAADIALRSNKILAQSRGDQTQIRKNIGAAEGRRIRLAQGNLDKARVSAGAGDIGGLSAEASRLLKRQAVISKEITRTNLSEDQKIKLENESVENARQLKAVNAELERLATQTGRVDDLFSEMSANVEMIEKERRKREQVIGVVEDFVVGGQKTRRALVDSANGIRKAFATGTLQNQSEEQRSSTIGLLEKLSDVPLLNGFTGKEIKQELIFRDAIRLGLDPKIAQMLATATTKEQQLIDSNERLAFQLFLLTQEMTQARVAQAALGFANGGMVQYRAGGGSIFKPRGTDTVPAMLTPGEFVIQKSAVDRIGADNLAAMNGGGTAYHRKGGIVSYFNGGGSVEEMREFAKAYIEKLIIRDLSPGASGIKPSGDRTGGQFYPTLAAQGYPIIETNPLIRLPADTREHESLHFMSSLFAKLQDEYGEIPSDMYSYVAKEYFAQKGHLGGQLTESSLRLMAKGASKRFGRVIGRSDEQARSGAVPLFNLAQFEEEYLVAMALRNFEGYSNAGIESAQNRLKNLDMNIIPASLGMTPDTPISKEQKIKIFQELQDRYGDQNPYILTADGNLLPNMDHPLRRPASSMPTPPMEKVTEARKNATESEARKDAKKQTIKPTPVKPTDPFGILPPGQEDDPFGILSPQSPGVDEAAQAKRNERAKLQIGPDGDISSVTDRDRAMMSPKDSKPTEQDKRDRKYLAPRDSKPTPREKRDREYLAPRDSKPTPRESRDRKYHSDQSDSYYRRRQKGFTSIPEPTKPASVDPVNKKPRTYKVDMDDNDFGKHLRGKEFTAYREFIKGGNDYRSAEAKRLLQQGKDAIAAKERAKVQKQQEEEAKKTENLLKKGEAPATPAEPSIDDIDPFAKKPKKPSSRPLDELIDGVKTEKKAQQEEAKKKDPVKPLPDDPASEYMDSFDPFAEKPKKSTPLGESTAKEIEEAEKRSPLHYAGKRKSSEELAKTRKEYLEKKREGTRPIDKQKKRARYLRQRVAQLRRYGQIDGVVVDEAAKFGVDAPRHRGFQPLFGANMSRSQALAIASQEYDSGNLAYGTGRPAGPRSTTAPAGGMGPAAPNTVRIKATYERLLRTQGPMVAQQYAQRFGYTPPGGFGGGRGITRPFRERSGGGMGGPMDFQQFMMMNQMQSRMQKQGYRGGVMYRATGGGVSGADTIPAMLTPGEFVMSAGAVRQHGVGAMRSLNKGQVPGFNRGGMVGGVAYRTLGSKNAEVGSGSAFAIDTEGLEVFQQSFDKTVQGIASSLEGVSDKLGHFEMSHTFSGEVGLNVTGVDIDPKIIADQFSAAFTDMVKTEIEQAFDNRNKNVQTPGQGP